MFEPCCPAERDAQQPLGKVEVVTVKQGGQRHPGRREAHSATRAPVVATLHHWRRAENSSQTSGWAVSTHIHQAGLGEDAPIHSLTCFQAAAGSQALF